MERNLSDAVQRSSFRGSSSDESCGVSFSGSSFLISSVSVLLLSVSVEFATPSVLLVTSMVSFLAGFGGLGFFLPLTFPNSFLRPYNLVTTSWDLKTGSSYSCRADCALSCSSSHSLTSLILSSTYWRSSSLIQDLVSLRSSVFSVYPSSAFCAVYSTLSRRSCSSLRSTYD